MPTIIEMIKENKGAVNDSSQTKNAVCSMARTAVLDNLKPDEVESLSDEVDYFIAPVATIRRADIMKHEGSEERWTRLWYLEFGE